MENRRLKQGCGQVIPCDMINKLPDSILCHILCFVPTTKSVVAASVLSRRWKLLWTKVTTVCFDDQQFSALSRRNNFVPFVNRVLLGHAAESLDKFQLTWMDECQSLYVEDQSLPKLISGCPVLQSLRIKRSREEEDDDVLVCSISSPSLRYFLISNEYPLDGKQLPALDFLDFLSYQWKEFSFQILQSESELGLHSLLDFSGSHMERCNSMVRMVEAVNHVNSLKLGGALMMALSIATTPLTVRFERLTHWILNANAVNGRLWVY
ncbi:OLC1v1010381C1 [Oldenlandia corymbosa var. corymbosa]|uniref:OLC1v1010381C1 n=1 Tax=Oldenlandia corymbosa var. corymbosa TaxID=529605 RepID=A0AAV1DSW1_OLDCO|nr:OLC1v1010381C1 [Oldenlandia corymbosa var. corymbosa]